MTKQPLCIQILLSGMLTLLILPAYTSTLGCKRNSKNRTTDTVAVPATRIVQADKLAERTTGAFKNPYKVIYARLNGSSQSEQMGGMDFSGNLYWVRDSMVWLSLKKFGFEGMRVLITPQKVVVLNRLEKTALIKDATWLESRYGIADGFAMLQAMLLNQPLYLPQAEKTTALKDSMHVLTQRDGHRVLHYLFTEGDYRLQKVELTELRQQINVSCVFKAWQEPGAKAFSSRLREWDFYSPTEGAASLSLRFEEVEFNQPREVKFEIPAHYERI